MHFLKEFFLPPGLLIVVSVVGIFLLKSRPRLGKTLLILSISLLYFLTTEWTGRMMLSTLENIPVLDLSQLEAQGVDAMVILGAGLRPEAPEYGGATVSGDGLARIRYGAYLHRRLQKPIWITGGKTSYLDVSEASLMKQVLEQELHVPVFLIEETSLNTLENAKNSSILLKTQGVQKIYLVTHAFHMKRARMLFEKFGIKVIPAPTCFLSRSRFSIEDLLPTSIWQVRLALQEWLGIFLIQVHLL